MMDIIKATAKKGAFLAPLAGISDLPFRRIARAQGCALAYTEMISSNGLVRKTVRTYNTSKPVLMTVRWERRFSAPIRK